MQDKDTMLRMMRFWLFGTFIIIFTATTVYVGGALGTGLGILKEMYFWLAIVVTVALCILWYFVYSWYLDKKM